MSYLDNLKTEANYTKTLNGAKTHGSTGDACLDLFSVAGGMRCRSEADQIRLFDRAYIENPEIAMKLLFHIRDIRGGIGEREIFRTLIRHVAKTWPESAKKNVRWISEFGRWDDLMCLMGTSAQKEVCRIIQKQLQKDLDAIARRENGELDAPVSLLGKWLPSGNTSSARTRGQAKVLMQALKMSSEEYRKMLTKLRANSCITERYLTNQQVEKINYEAVPAKAMLTYRSAFQRQDPKRFDTYVEAVACGDAKMHSDTLFPYEILRPYFKGGYLAVTPDGEAVLDALWDNLPMEIGSQNAIAVVDTSGSMYCNRPGTPKPALISQALGIYFAERCQGVFRNHMITFESNPHLMELHGRNLAEKLRYVQSFPWGMSTNLEAVFNLILRTAVNSGAKQKEMPAVIYIISDMEFNCAVLDPQKTVYENARKRFEAYGYQMPAVVFQNVNSWQMQAPVTANTRGAALVSGAGTAAMKEKFDGNVTPMSHMLKVLNSKRYEAIHA